ATATANISGWIGARGGASYFLNGRIDESAVYNVVLRAAQVTSHYDARNGQGPGALPTPTNSTTNSPPNTPTASTTAYRALTLSQTGLISYWRLGEASGTSALDSKGSNTGTYQNGVTLGAAGALSNDTNTAASFNGTSSRVSLPALASVTDFSIEGWSYLNSGATANPNGNNALYATGGNVTLVARPGTPNTSPAAYASVWLGGVEYSLQPTSTQTNLNGWVYWTLTRTGSTLTLYRNGVQIAQRSDLPATATANISGWIGAWGGASYFLNGRIDEVAVYNVALSAAQVAARYNTALNGPAPTSGSFTTTSAQVVQAPAASMLAADTSGGNILANGLLMAWEGVLWLAGAA